MSDFFPFFFFFDERGNEKRERFRFLGSVSEINLLKEGDGG